MTPPAARTAKPEDAVVPFGKHKNKTLGDILASNPSYLDWLNGIDLYGSLKTHVAAMNVKYAVEIGRALGIDESPPDESPRVYTFGLVLGSYILQKDNGHKFRMRGSEDEALEEARFVCEVDGAVLKVLMSP